MNERWRVALAGLVAALAIPFLIVDSPAPAEGVETKDEEIAQDLAAPTGNGDDVETEAQPEVVEVEPLAQAVEIIVSTTEVTPDIARLADQAGTWGLARAQAIEDGRVDATFTPPPSNTDYSLLPVVNTTPVTTAPPVDDPVAEEPDPEPIPPEEEATETAPGEGDATEVEPGPSTPEDGEGEAPAETPEHDGESDDVEPEPAPTPDPEPDVPTVDQPGVPAQVNGRVPPPAGGPTAAQWDAVRRCESTHNYAAISPSGLYRGAYQFSQQTWDWVAGIHYPYLVGIDPAQAEPAWQDVMAYTLYAMRGWDQWPICGKNLL